MCTYVEVCGGYGFRGEYGWVEIVEILFDTTEMILIDMYCLR